MSCSICISKKDSLVKASNYYGFVLKAILGSPGRALKFKTVCSEFNFVFVSHSKSLFLTSALERSVYRVRDRWPTAANDDIISNRDSVPKH